MVPKKELWWGQVDPSLVLALFLTSCVTWGKWFNSGRRGSSARVGCEGGNGRCLLSVWCTVARDPLPVRTGVLAEHPSFHGQVNIKISGLSPMPLSK